MNSLFTLFVLFSYVVSYVSAQTGGFSIVLYNRDGPDTPFYNSNLTKTDRFIRAIKRDLARVKSSINIAPNTPSADLKEDEGRYMMKISIGTPPYSFFATADTGSEQTWIQCEPCQRCYDMVYSVFKPSDSSTYNKISCISGQFPCPNFDSVKCIDSVCKYLAHYGDNSFSKGVLSTDVMTIQSDIPNPPVVVHDYIFGCGHHNNGIFSNAQAGMIGLGRGQRSLITQLGKHIDGKFSYCLFHNIQGKVNFGKNAILQGPDVVTTPLFEKGGKDFAFYLATLEALTIGNEMVKYNTLQGNIIIDSGSTMTQFPKNFYKSVVDSVKRQIRARPVRDPSKNLKTCFEDVNGSFKFIPVTAHFTGADLVLEEFNMFQTVAPGVICLTIMQGPKAIWGNVAQMDFLVGFDLAVKPSGTVSFKRGEC